MTLEGATMRARARGWHGSQAIDSRGCLPHFNLKRIKHRVTARAVRCEDLKEAVLSRERRPVWHHVSLFALQALTHTAQSSLAPKAARRGRDDCKPGGSAWLLK